MQRFDASSANLVFTSAHHDRRRQHYQSTTASAPPPSSCNHQVIIMQSSSSQSSLSHPTTSPRSRRPWRWFAGRDTPPPPHAPNSIATPTFQNILKISKMMFIFS
jgi:hypothetical protein